MHYRNSTLNSTLNTTFLNCKCMCNTFCVSNSVAEHHTSFGDRMMIQLKIIDSKLTETRLLK